MPDVDNLSEGDRFQQGVRQETPGFFLKGAARSTGG